MPLNGLNLETSCSQTVAYDGKQLRSMPSAEPQAPSVIWIPQNWDGDQTVFEVLNWTYRENPEKSFSLSFIPAIEVNLESPVKHSWPVCGPLCHPRASLLSSKLTCYCSVTQSSPTLCHPWPVACQASLSLTISQSLTKFVFIASHPVMPSSPSARSLSQHQELFQWAVCLHQMTKILELQLQHQSLQWIFRVDHP